MGVGLGPATVPGGAAGFELGGDEIELGLGIHGEPGVELQVDFGHMGYLVDPADGRRRKVHALIFTAGIGENSPKFRALVCDQLGALGITLDPTLNEAPRGDVARISAETSAIEVLVVATDEERAIAEATAGLVWERVKK